MTQIVYDEYNIRKIYPLNNRFQTIKDIYHANAQDESVRWECVWLAGEIYEQVTKHFQNKLADFMVFILVNDDNGVVKHEAAFQIGLHNMKNKIGILIEIIDTCGNTLTRHEGIEALGLLRFYTPMLDVWATDPDESVRETAIFVLKRLARLKGTEYKGEAII